MVEEKEKHFFFVIITLAVIILDQLVKLFILESNPHWTLSALEIHLVTNTGAGFGILQNKTTFLALISLLVALIVIWNYQKIPKEKIVQFLSALFLGGVLGNFLDRAFRQQVIDFIDFHFWPAFNLADCAISLAVLGLIWYSWRENKNKLKAD